ncbi:MAG: FAD-dependent pyridine nucleotide-disulfide oxidoreductase [Ignavibacteria bacterium]|nr:FAD-dependent pyridine nucleotide-disulfide oxidoreductase [Ignavibacteria bacterium]
MGNINLTINGQQVTSESGQTILQVVEQYKIDKIPTLCHDKRLEPYASCYLCVVEVKGLNKLVPSCATPINEGMVVTTNSEKIFESRKSVIELLMSNHYADCIGPCISSCPASVDAQGYLALIAMGRYEEALKLIKKTNPLPLSIGRVCVRNCEDACRRCYVDSPVAINYLKRFVADLDYNTWTPECKPATGKKIAIIGGGPAGLTCAYYLTLDGHKTEIFEKLPELGGMLKYGIPEYRLPKEVLDAEIKWITDLGVEIHCNSEMGKDYTIADLKSRGFDAIYLSVGAHKATSMGLDGENVTQGVWRGIDYLREVEAQGAPVMKGTAIIVGGGNTAIDAARTALRCGADKVKIVYRRSIKEMPAHPMEIEAAHEEGVEINILTLPKSMVTENGKIKGIECIKMQLEETTPGQRPRPVPIPNSDFFIDCDYLISAIGQQVDLSFIENEKDCKLEKWGTVVVDRSSFETSIPGVFAGGDVVDGPLTAVNAIGHGKKAATSIDAYLKTGKPSGKNGKFYSFKHRFGTIPDSEFTSFTKEERSKMPELGIKTRVNNFDEVELGLSEEAAMAEAFRCLECGCSEYTDCSFRKYGDEFHINIDSYLGDVRKFKIDKRHPLIQIDPNKCINCGKCVRICSEVLDVSALGFVQRGFKSVVKPAMEKPLLETNCINCGNCIDVCPTGAIADIFPFKFLGTMPKMNFRSVCNFCSIGCNVNYKVIDEKMYWVQNSNDEIQDSPNTGYLCLKGRFGHRFLQNENTLKSAMVKENGTLMEVSTDEALTIAGKQLKDIIAKYGNDSVAVFGSPKSTNEELYLIQKFARAGLKTNNVGSLSNLLYNTDGNWLNDLLGVTVSTMTMQDVKYSDVIVVINADLTEDNLIMELKIKDALKTGTKLVVISSYESNLAKTADLWLDTRRGTNAALMSGVINSLLTEKNISIPELSESSETFGKFSSQNVAQLTGTSQIKFNEFLQLLNGADTNISFVYNLDNNKEKSTGDLQAIGNYLSLTGRLNKAGNGLLLIREFSNSVGADVMGLNPEYLPGYVGLTESSEINRIAQVWNSDLSNIFRTSEHAHLLLNDLQNSKIKAAVVFGENPLSQQENEQGSMLPCFSGLECLIVFDNFDTETVKAATAALPMGNCIEQHGSYTSFDTKIQYVEPVFKNKSGLENWQVISKFAANFGSGFEFSSFEELTNEINEINRIFSGCKDGDYFNQNENNLKTLNKLKKVDYLKYTVELAAFKSTKPAMHSSDLFVEELKTRVNV